MMNVSKKAQHIFEATYSTLYAYVRGGKKFDCLSNVVCDTRYTITKSTIKDLERMCKVKFDVVERHVKWYGNRRHGEAQIEVEVMRRMWLTIQNASREVDKWGSSVTS